MAPKKHLNLQLQIILGMENEMELWTINNDLVPWNHEYYVKFHTFRPWDSVELLELVPEWVYGAHGSVEIIHESNNHAAREELSLYSDGMGGSCADHISTSCGMLSVPLWRDDERGAEGGYHPAAIVGLSLIARMNDYPLLDEADYSERETDAWHAYLTDEFNWIDDGKRDGEKINFHRTRFVVYAWENLLGYYSVYDVPAEAINRAYAVTKEADNA